MNISFTLLGQMPKHAWLGHMSILDLAEKRELREAYWLAFYKNSRELGSGRRRDAAVDSSSPGGNEGVFTGNGLESLL